MSDDFDEFDEYELSENHDPELLLKFLALAIETISPNDMRKEDFAYANIISHLNTHNYNCIELDKFVKYCQKAISHALESNGNKQIDLINADYYAKLDPHTKKLQERAKHGLFCIALAAGILLLSELFKQDKKIDVVTKSKVFTVQYLLFGLGLYFLASPTRLPSKTGIAGSKENFLQWVENLQPYADKLAKNQARFDRKNFNKKKLKAS